MKVVPLEQIVAMAEFAALESETQDWGNLYWDLIGLRQDGTRGRHYDSGRITDGEMYRACRHAVEQSYDGGGETEAAQHLRAQNLYHVMEGETRPRIKNRRSWVADKAIELALQKYNEKMGDEG